MCEVSVVTMVTYCVMCMWSCIEYRKQQKFGVAKACMAVDFVA